MVNDAFPMETLNLVIDDTLIPRHPRRRRRAAPFGTITPENTTDRSICWRHAESL